MAGKQTAAEVETVARKARFREAAQAVAEEPNATTWARTVLGFDFIRQLSVYKIDSNGKEGKVGALTRDMIGDDDTFDLDPLLIRNYRGGKFVLYAEGIMPGLVGLRNYGRKVLSLAPMDAGDRLNVNADLQSLDSILADRGRRLVAIEAMDLMQESIDHRRERKTTGGGDEMKPAEMAELMKGMAEVYRAMAPGQPGQTDQMMTFYKEQFERMQRQLETVLQQHQQNGTLGTLIPSLFDLIGKKPNVLGTVMRFLNPRPPAVPAEPEPGFIGQMMKFLEPYLPQLMPTLMPLVAALAQRAGVQVSPELVRAAQLTEGNGGDMPKPREITPEQQAQLAEAARIQAVAREAMDFVIENVKAGAHAVAFHTMDATPLLNSWVENVEPGVAPVSFLFSLKAFDARWGAAELREKALEFIAFAQEEIRKRDEPDK